MTSFLGGQRESNPRLLLGKEKFYHSTISAFCFVLYTQYVHNTQYVHTYIIYIYVWSIFVQCWAGDSLQIESKFFINLNFIFFSGTIRLTPLLIFLIFIWILGTYIECECVSQPRIIQRVVSVFDLGQQGQEIRELRIPTRKTNPIHNDVPENTTFLLLDQPSGEANTTGTLINKIDEVAINAKTANWKARVMLLILQATNK